MGKSHTDTKSKTAQTESGRIKAAIYLRESSDEGVKNTNGLEIQKKHCLEFAARMEWDVIKIFSEEDVSGRIPIAQRPRGAELWRMVATREIGAVIASRKDRYSRDEWGIELPTFFRFCTENGVLIAADGMVLGADMAGRIQAFFGDLMAGEDRKKIAKMLWDGRRHLWESGTLIPAGHKASFGYKKIVRVIKRAEDGKNNREKIRHDLMIDEAEAAIVRECYRLLLVEKMSLRQITILMGRTYPNLRFLRAVHRLFTMPQYKGEFHYGDFETLYRPDLAIVDADTFAAAHEQLKRNFNFSKRASKRTYLLSGLMQCHCGRKIVGGQRGYYLCNSHMTPHAPRHERHSFHSGKLDDVVWNELVKICSDRELLRQAAREYVEAQGDRAAPLQAQLKSYRQEYTTAQSEADEYIKRAGRTGLSEELLARYEHEAEKAIARSKEIAARIQEVEAKLANTPHYDLSQIERVADMAQNKFAHGAPTFAQKRALVEWANLAGEVDETGRIKFKIELGIGFDVTNGTNGAQLCIHNQVNLYTQHAQKISLFFEIPALKNTACPSFVPQYTAA